MTSGPELSDAEREHILQRAVDLYSDNRLADCEDLLRRVVSAAPDEWRAWQLLGSTLAVQGQRIAAERCYRRVLELEPNEPYSLAALAEIALDALRWDDAKPLFERLFALDPEGKHPAANRGRQVLAETMKRLARG